MLPNGEQQRQMSRSAGCAPYVYHKALALKQERYQKKEKLTRFQLDKLLVQWKQETPWLAEAPCHALQQALLDLDRAYTNFIQKRAQFPKFHKEGIRDSFRESDPKCIKLDQVNRRIQLPKIGWVRYRNSREVLGEIRSVTVRLAVGKWLVSIRTLREVEPRLHPARSSVGLDGGVARFYTLSDGEYQEQLQPLRRFLPKLAKLQRRLARRKEFSSNWKKAKAKITQLHSKIAHIRKDVVHQSSKRHQQKPHRGVYRRPSSKEYVGVGQGQEGKAGKAGSPEVGTRPFDSGRQPVRTAAPAGVQDAVEGRSSGRRAAPEHKPQVSCVPPHSSTESQDANQLRVRRVWLLRPCGLGWCDKHQRGGTRLVSLFVIFACCQCVVSGTHRGDGMRKCTAGRNSLRSRRGGCQQTTSKRFLAPWYSQPGARAPRLSQSLRSALGLPPRHPRLHLPPRSCRQVAKQNPRASAIVCPHDFPGTFNQMGCPRQDEP